MSAAPLPSPEATFRRIFPRHPIGVAIDVIALRSGVPENLPGRCIDISESGLGAVLAGELLPDQPVAIELRLPHMAVPLRARALIRYQFRLRCGLELVGLTRDQRDMIRYWLYRSTLDARDIKIPPMGEKESKQEEIADTKEQEATTNFEATGGINLDARRKLRIHLNRRASYVLCLCILTVAVLGWWQWQRSWHELEAHAAAVESRSRVSAETMGVRIVSKVDPIYPEAARKAGTEGVVVLNAVIAPDGTVKKLRPVSGPDVLVQSATTAVGSWKFEPYLASGKAIEVETTIAVEFRLN